MSKDYNKRLESFHPGEVVQGVDVLRYLGAQARPAIPAVIELTKHKDYEVRYSAFSCLLHDLKPGDVIMRPVLMRLTNDPDRNIRFYAEEELADIEDRPSAFVTGERAVNPGTGSAAETNTAATNQPLNRP